MKYFSFYPCYVLSLQKERSTTLTYVRYSSNNGNCVIYHVLDWTCWCGELQPKRYLRFKGKTFGEKFIVYMCCRKFQASAFKTSPSALSVCRSFTNPHVTISVPKSGSMI